MLTKADIDRVGGKDRAAAIREALHDAIVERRIAPGTRLPEDEVGGLFEVSRTVARAALQALSYEGLVTIERNRGAFVASPSVEAGRQVFSARRLVEPGVAGEAARRITPEALAGLERHVEAEAAIAMGRSGSARRTEIKLSGEFHLMIAAATGNELVFRFLKELVARSSLVIALYGSSGASSCGRDEHGNIVDALKAGDGPTAERLMRQHIDHLEEDLDYREAEQLGLRQALFGA